MGGRPLEGPTMVGRTLDWNDELGRWLKPFVDRVGHRARRRMCPLYVSGLIGPGDRTSVQPMAELLVQADRLVGGRDAVLVIDDTFWVTPGSTRAMCSFESICTDRIGDRSIK